MSRGDIQITQNDTTICKGENLLINIENLRFQKGSLINNSTQNNFSSPWNISWNITPNNYYLLEINGSYGISSGNTCFDAAFEYCDLHHWRQIHDTGHPNFLPHDTFKGMLCEN